MTNEVLAAIKAKTEYLYTYFTVPPEMAPELKSFSADVHALGEQCADAVSFENAFAQAGFYERMNALIARLTPKSQAMTAEQKHASRDLAATMMFGSADKRDIRKGVAKLAAEEAADYVQVEAKEQMLSAGRKGMIEAGVFRDYTVATNRVEDAGFLGGFVSELFKKKG